MQLHLFSGGKIVGVNTMGFPHSYGNKFRIRTDESRSSKPAFSSSTQITCFRLVSITKYKLAISLYGHDFRHDVYHAYVVFILIHILTLQVIP